MRGRIYSPSTRQFLTPDPLGRLGASPYTYVSNNPLNWIDPTGFTEEDPEGGWYTGFGNLFGSVPIAAIDSSHSLVAYAVAAVAAMDYPNGNDAPNSSGCPDGTGTAPRPCAAPGEAGCSSGIGPPTADEYDAYYTQSQLRTMAVVVEFLTVGFTGVLDFYGAEANSRPDAGVEPSELPIAGPPDSPDAEWEGGMLADPAMRSATGLGLNLMVGAVVTQGILAGMTATELPNLPRSVGAAANITTRSRIGGSSFAVRQAKGLSQAAQRDVDGLLGQIRSGNMNPGIGTRPLGGGFFELRGANAGRVIIKDTGAGTFDIVGKFQGHVRGDAANSAIIQKLMKDYNAL